MSGWCTVGGGGGGGESAVVPAAVASIQALDVMAAAEVVMVVGGWVRESGLAAGCGRRFV